MGWGRGGNVRAALNFLLVVNECFTLGRGEAYIEGRLHVEQHVGWRSAGVSTFLEVVSMERIVT